WVDAPAANIESATTMAGASVNLTRLECDIAVPPLDFLFNPPTAVVVIDATMFRPPSPTPRAQWPFPYLFAPSCDVAPGRRPRQWRQGSASASASAWRRPAARR